MNFKNSNITLFIKYKLYIKINSNQAKHFILINWAVDIKIFINTSYKLYNF